MRRSTIDDTRRQRQSRSATTFAVLNDPSPTRVQKMMRHQHYARTEIYVEPVQKLLEGGGNSDADLGGWIRARSGSELIVWILVGYG